MIISIYICLFVFVHYSVDALKIIDLSTLCANNNEETYEADWGFSISGTINRIAICTINIELKREWALGYYDELTEINIRKDELLPNKFSLVLTPNDNCDVANVEVLQMNDDTLAFNSDSTSVYGKVCGSAPNVSPIRDGRNNRKFRIIVYMGASNAKLTFAIDIFSYHIGQCDTTLFSQFSCEPFSRRCIDAQMRCDSAFSPNCGDDQYGDLIGVFPGNCRVGQVTEFFTTSTSTVDPNLKPRPNYFLIYLICGIIGGLLLLILLYYCCWRPGWLVWHCSRCRNYSFCRRCGSQNDCLIGPYGSCSSQRCCGTCCACLGCYGGTTGKYKNFDMSLLPPEHANRFNRIAPNKICYDASLNNFEKMPEDKIPKNNISKRLLLAAKDNGKEEKIKIQIPSKSVTAQPPPKPTTPPSPKSDNSSVNNGLRPEKILLESNVNSTELNDIQKSPIIVLPKNEDGIELIEKNSISRKHEEHIRQTTYILEPPPLKNSIHKEFTNIRSPEGSMMNLNELTNYHNHLGDFTDESIENEHEIRNRHSKFNLPGWTKYWNGDGGYFRDRR
ncbi:hypothetical protein SNEBB_008444 [Seison nebaliae]|nr:hypothetical protein SNEBB_008444 [Seison nebaliae]